MICFLRLMFVLQLLQIDSVQVQVLQLIRWNRKYEILCRRSIHEIKETILIFSWRRRRPNTLDLIDRKKMSKLITLLSHLLLLRESLVNYPLIERRFFFGKWEFFESFFYQSGLWSLCSELKCQLDTIAPKKEVIARPCHWWTLLQACHNFGNHDLEKGI